MAISGSPHNPRRRRVRLLTRTLSASFHSPTRTTDRAPILLRHVIGTLEHSYPQWIGPYPGPPEACAVAWRDAVGCPPRSPTQRTSLAPCAGTIGSRAEYSALRVTQQGLTFWVRSASLSVFLNPMVRSFTI